MIEYIYFAGIGLHLYIIGQERAKNPQGFLVDFVTTILILLWPLMFALMIFTRRET